MPASRALNIMVLAGDGVGPEVVGEALRVLDWFATNCGVECQLTVGDFGAEFYHRSGTLLREETLADLLEADAVLFGAFGGTIDGHVVPQAIRNRFGLLAIRHAMGLFANLRPMKIMPGLSGASPLREEVSRGVDLMVLRELAGGIYYGEPRGITDLGNGQRRGVNTEVYTTPEIRRIGEMAFALARQRRRRVTSVDKANVMESGRLWREEITTLHGQGFGDVELNHFYIDNCALQLVRNPRQFDVIVTGNIFGDILSDCAAGIGGSLGLAPSASFSEPKPEGGRRALYEPVHGSAPDIAGRGIANPVAAILSLAMALEHSFNLPDEAHLLEQAVEVALGIVRTADLKEDGKITVSTSGMGDAVIAALDRLSGHSARQHA